MSFLYNYFFPPKVVEETTKTNEEIKSVICNKHIPKVEKKILSKSSRIMLVKKPKRSIKIEHRHNELPPKMTITIENNTHNFYKINKKIRKNHIIRQPNQWKR